MANLLIIRAWTVQLVTIHSLYTGSVNNLKLPNSYGSITKLSGNRRRPFMVRKTTGYDAEGRQIQKPIAYFAKRTEALAFLATLGGKHIDVDAMKLTFAQVHDRWETATYVDGKEQSNQYKAAYARCEPIWNVPFAELKTADFQKLINDCDKGYASKKAIRIVCNLITKYALANDIAQKNYVELAKLPPQPKSKKHKPFTAEEMEKLWRYSHDFNVQSVLILCYTGLRPTELCEIKKTDVDFQQKTFFGGIKTDAGKNRIIPLADKILPFVRAAYDYSTGDNLYSNEDGGPVNYDWYRVNIWDVAMEELDMQHLPHDGRHTCATMLDNHDTNAKIKKLILGHASSDVTEKVYTHKTVEQLLEAINKI